MVRPLIVAHRGFSAEAPENTLAAFQRAVDVGATLAECDVRRTRDGHIVLLHDATLDRTTSGSGPVAEKTFDELRALDAGSWKSPGYAGENVPTLGETLGVTAGKLLLIVEIKAEGITEAVLDILRARPPGSEVAIVSFSYETCCRSRQLAPEIPVAWLGSGAAEGDETGARELCRQALAGNIQALSVHHEGASATLRRETRRAMLALWAWTVDEPGQVIALAEAGMDSITTNRPDMGLATIREWAAAPKGAP